MAEPRSALEHFYTKVTESRVEFLSLLGGSIVQQNSFLFCPSSARTFKQMMLTSFLKLRLLVQPLNISTDERDSDWSFLKTDPPEAFAIERNAFKRCRPSTVETFEFAHATSFSDSILH